MNKLKSKAPGKKKNSRTKSVTSAIPADLKPMLAGITDAAFDSADWQFEIKWDGYRALAYLQNGKVDLRSRNNLSFNKKYTAVYEALQKWKVDAVVDGEIVVLDDKGHADFAALQKWNVHPHGNLVFIVFDILWLEGESLVDKPLVERRAILQKKLPASNVIRYSEAIDEHGIDFLKVAAENGLEGIIAKKKNSSYLPGYRTKEWLKIKIEARHEAVICGYTRKKDSDRLFSSLILGLPDKNGVKFIGQVGTGFTAASQKEIMAAMKPLLVKDCPFEKIPATTAPPVWIKPSLVCEVKYTELTKDGVMRHPSFQGLREDKSMADLNEEEKTAKTPETAEKSLPAKNKNVLIEPGEKEKIVTIERRRLKLTNLQKIYWPKEKITKGDLLNYYHLMAPYILPYMKDRPQSLNRYPNGIEGKSFYQKDMAGKVEPWIKTHRRFSESVGEDKDFMVCTGEASLLYMANLGCIEMNPWHSRVQKPLNPDWSVIDLDPGDIAFEKVVETALVIKQLLDSYQINSYVKTSGSTGLHIYIPFGAKYSYDQSKQFAELIVNIAHQDLPDTTSLERNPLKRKTKIYLDYLQNRPIQTICAPYSVRPKPGATVSAPLHWSEVKKGLQIAQFDYKNIYARVQAEGDLFKGVLGKGINLQKVISQLAALL